MKTFVLKLRTNSDVENGIAIVASNNSDTVLRTYEKKDEVLRTYEGSVAYSWFLIPVDENEVIFVNNKKWRRYREKEDGVKDTICVNATPELYYSAKKAGVVLPEMYYEALKTSLTELFMFPVFSSETRKWNSVKVFMQYKNLLPELEKKVNDFVEQSQLDKFFESLVNLYAATEIKSFIDGGLIRLSQSTKQKVDELMVTFAQIRRWAFSLAKEYSNEHNWYMDWMHETEYKGKPVTLMVKCYHLYVIFPYGKDSSITECVGWFED